ncbi:methyl-accepting chemotaxis protein [Halorhabdus sp. BNX81]|uniref:HAMP domain-containing protein n=1 Tax=Halorhabdus sp. BNX81 TaxID=2980181 RepID=UPI0023DD47F6|nr:methyl-accepting chemotaxis protein [Halorhabdus sp. BNX81]WEL22155.1 Methyl-accepting chemotaxis protein [Halorhabdus sp. BNX81]
MSNDPDIEANGDEPESGAIGRILATVVPDVIRKRFALKFALVLVIMGLILAGIGFTATGALADQVEDDTRAEYERLASQQASIVEQWIQRNAVTVDLASTNDGLGADKSDTGTLNRQLARPLFSEVSNGSHAIYLLSPDNGTEILAMQYTGDTIEEVNRGLLQSQTIPVAETTHPWLSNLQVGIEDYPQVRMTEVYDVSGEPVVGFIKRVEHNVANRYLYMEFRVGDLAKAIESQGLTEGDASTHFSQVVNVDNAVQADTRTNADGVESNILGTYGNEETIRRAMAAPADGQQRTSGVRIIENDPAVLDEPYAVGYASVDGEVIDPPWTIVTHAPTSDLFGFVQTISRWGQIVTILAAIMIGGVGAILGYSTASSVDRLRRKAEEIEEGNLDVPIHSTRIDSIGRLYDGFDNMRDALREQINEAEQARKEAEVSRAEAMEMNEYLQEKAEEYSQTMEQCAAGDLTARMEIDGENEAMDRIASEFNEMIDELEKTTGQLKSFADEVEDAGEIVLNSSDSVQEASEQVADSVQRISDDAYEQQERLQEISKEIDAISARLDEFAAEHPDIDFEDQLAQIDEVARTVAEVVDLAEETLEESESVAGAAEEQAAELNEVSQRADDLIRYAGPLHDVLDRFETQSEHEFYFPTGPRDGEGPGE